MCRPRACAGNRSAHDPMREIDLLLLEELTMRRSLGRTFDRPAWTRVLQVVPLLLVVAGCGGMLAHSLSRTVTADAQPPQQIGAVNPSSGIFIQAPGAP
jgi:hypothetical protein